MNHENNSYHRTVNLDKLEYVYGLIAYNNQAFLFCFDAHQHRIPVEFKGFKKPYITLSERFGFKDKLFYDTISQNKQTKARIWKGTTKRITK